ncbi:unnamed protein product [Discula destructiva]
MLLKQSNPEHATHTGMSPRSLSPSDTTHGDVPHMDPLDDVFGSADDDGSPIFEHEFDASHRAETSGHPSDIHRLQQEHTTAGYRDGVATAKAGSVQAGFDEGFGLGGTIGLKVGRLLGLLEGIVAALAADKSVVAEWEGASKLLADARAELDLQNVFSQVYWNADGTWKYAIEEGEGQAGEEGDVLFSHVAEAHPLVRKWTGIVEAQMNKWGVQEQLPLLQRKDDENRPAMEPAAKAKVPSQSQGEAKAPSDALSW